MKKTKFRLTAPLYEKLRDLLFPGDGDEHGAVIAAGISERTDETRFLGHDIIIARDGIDYVPGKYGYRALTADFVARISNLCAKQNLCYFAVHCHGGDDWVDFSGVDLQSHQRGYPALLDITNGGPVGALVFARNAVAGEIWTRHEVRQLDDLTVVGQNLRRIYPHPPSQSEHCEESYGRQSLMFGAAGQTRLSATKVGIIGLGGVGSLINEWLARLGVGEITAVDFDKVECSNRSRIVGSRSRDSQDWLRASRLILFRKLGDYLATNKVGVAERVALEANPKIQFHSVADDVADLKTAMLLRDSDFLFLCADSMQSRLVFNALVHQYLIPGIQIGSKIPVDEDTGDLGNIFSAARLVLPQQGGGCLLCNQLISAMRLQEEALSEQERRQQAYVNDPQVTAPSVITLNALGAAQAANDFLFCLLGLFDVPNAGPDISCTLLATERGVQLTAHLIRRVATAVHRILLHSLSGTERNFRAGRVANVADRLYFIRSNVL